MSASMQQRLDLLRIRTRPSSCSRSSAVNVRGGRIGRACSSSVRGETKVGRASLGRASVSPDMVAAMLARIEPEPHGGMCAAHRRSVDSQEVGRACALIVGNAAKLRLLQTTTVRTDLQRGASQSHSEFTWVNLGICSILLPERLACTAKIWEHAYMEET
jgi:hypothetical protein